MNSLSIHLPLDREEFLLRSQYRAYVVGYNLTALIRWLQSKDFDRKVHVDAVAISGRLVSVTVDWYEEAPENLQPVLGECVVNSLYLGAAMEGVDGAYLRCPQYCGGNASPADIRAALDAVRNDTGLARCLADHGEEEFVSFCYKLRDAYTRAASAIGDSVWNLAQLGIGVAADLVPCPGVDPPPTHDVLMAAWFECGEQLPEPVRPPSGYLLTLYERERERGEMAATSYREWVISVLAWIEYRCRRELDDLSAENESRARRAESIIQQLKELTKSLELSSGMATGQIDDSQRGVDQEAAAGLQHGTPHPLALRESDKKLIEELGVLTAHVQFLSGADPGHGARVRIAQGDGISAPVDLDELEYKILYLLGSTMREDANVGSRPRADWGFRDAEELTSELQELYGRTSPREHLPKRIDAIRHKLRLARLDDRLISKGDRRGYRLSTLPRLIEL